ncbi:uncharacterized protein K460DRAFT_406630 [Cucurbitaria berberidis CBS 394.84]|uniref:Uncharacterized protein n=1 Tax=Cucurbitaria berberidis CBS 394.84 TaxID=1168544 RepID=A0A9P4GHT4_9PLEO|nr:uncharacterized protein K460DRAFT_406630 [Cucurbitaria berberidis CBS 394.84]KAF1846423.1 hypothetical protein K460DRAFT_406630 [Cucurbitaria berberidis CBS 394.84]
MQPHDTLARPSRTFIELSNSNDDIYSDTPATSRARQGPPQATTNSSNRVDTNRAGCTRVQPTINLSTSTNNGPVRNRSPGLFLYHSRSSVFDRIACIGYTAYHNLITARAIDNQLPQAPTPTPTRKQKKILEAAAIDLAALYSLMRYLKTNTRARVLVFDDKKNEHGTELLQAGILEIDFPR